MQLEGDSPAERLQALQGGVIGKSGKKREARPRDVAKVIKGEAESSQVLGDIVDRYSGDLLHPAELPPTILDDIQAALDDYISRYGMESLEKCSGLQWRGACGWVGFALQKSGILKDKERERWEGEAVYDAERVAALLPIWQHFCVVYRHPPLAADFVSFTGVSMSWFYGDKGHPLTSERVELAKKARDIEEAGLSAALTDHRENPTGRIYYTKARLGWRETTEIIHTDAREISPDEIAARLPDMDD